ncbi:MAG: hypothetical protein ACOYNF_16810 [Rhodoferax sp.]
MRPFWRVEPVAAQVVELFGGLGDGDGVISQRLAGMLTVFRDQLDYFIFNS